MPAVETSTVSFRCARGMGSNRGAVVGGIALGLFQQTASVLVGGIFASVAVFVVVSSSSCWRGPRASRALPLPPRGAYEGYRRHRPSRRAAVGSSGSRPGCRSWCCSSPAGRYRCSRFLSGRDRDARLHSIGCSSRAQSGGWIAGQMPSAGWHCCAGATSPACSRAAQPCPRCRRSRAADRRGVRKRSSAGSSACLRYGCVHSTSP